MFVSLPILVVLANNCPRMSSSVSTCNISEGWKVRSYHRSYNDKVVPVNDKKVIKVKWQKFTICHNSLASVNASCSMYVCQVSVLLDTCTSSWCDLFQIDNQRRVVELEAKQTESVNKFPLFDDQVELLALDHSTHFLLAAEHDDHESSSRAPPKACKFLYKEFQRCLLPFPPNVAHIVALNVPIC